MKNKLMFIGLSVMAAGSIVPSVGNSGPVCNILTATVKEQFAQGLLKYCSKNLTWVLGSKQVADAYVLNALTPEQKSTIEQKENRAYQAYLTFGSKTPAHASNHTNASVSAQDLNAEMITTAPFHVYAKSVNDQATLSQCGLNNSDVEQNLNQNNSNGSSKNCWKTAFAKAFGLIAAAFTGATVDSMNSTDSEVQEVSAPVDETTTSIANDMIDQTVTGNVLPIAHKQPVAQGVTPIASSSRFGYFPHDGKVVTTVAVAAVVGLSYAAYKAYKKGYFSRLNPFGKAAQVKVAQEKSGIAKL